MDANPFSPLTGLTLERTLMQWDSMTLLGLWRDLSGQLFYGALAHEDEEAGIFTYILAPVTGNYRAAGLKVSDVFTSTLLRVTVSYHEDAEPTSGLTWVEAIDLDPSFLPDPDSLLV